MLEAGPYVCEASHLFREEWVSSGNTLPVCIHSMLDGIPATVVTSTYLSGPASRVWVMRCGMMCVRSDGRVFGRREAEVKLFSVSSS